MNNSKHSNPAPRIQTLRYTKAIEPNLPRTMRSAQQVKGDKRIHFREEMITPDMASAYLKRNKCNRPLRQNTIKRYSRDMKAGHWELTHQGIAFDKKGNLIDGQHRMHAIIMADCPVAIVVARHVDPKANIGIDSGYNRNSIDVLHFRGIQADFLSMGVSKWMSFNVSEGVKALKDSTKSERIDFYLKHREAISAIVSIFQKGKILPRIRLSCIVAVFVRAYYTTKDKLKLEHAAEVLKTGMGGEEERWLIMLRNYLYYLKSVSAEDIRCEIYLKTERALHAYLNGEEVVGNLRPTSKELFPLPDEKINETAKNGKPAIDSDLVDNILEAQAVEAKPRRKYKKRQKTSKETEA